MDARDGQTGLSDMVYLVVLTLPGAMHGHVIPHDEDADERAHDIHHCGTKSKPAASQQLSAALGSAGLNWVQLGADNSGKEGARGE